MTKHYCSNTTKRFIILLTLFLFTGLAFATTSNNPNIVNTYNDDQGWKLKVDGEDYFVKGMVWGYTPIGENYSYNLWANSDEQIKKILDYECNLMKKAGVNTIRQFGIIPPEWVTYIYREHGIMTVVNHLMGRYGYTVGGKWYVWTNYADPLTRETLIKDFTEMVNKYKDVPGVLAFALGNESNYGLEWASFEIENLPEGERYHEKATHLYTLFNEAMRQAKIIDNKHPYLIVNGDIQYLDIIKEQCKDMDILGVNSYRGVSFTDMWQRVHDELGLPVMLTEFGSDAFNALTYKEDQEGQANLIKGNWVEIYNKSYGNEEEGNALGGCQFEWRDEWWKYKQTENLDVQDNHASWSNGGYSFDFVNGQDNMNEERFGICRLTGPNDDGVYEAIPRMAYDVLKEIWKIDPYTNSKMELNQKLLAIDMDFLKMKSNLRT
ncbi:MAG: glycosidase, partial [Candidatus Cloacimonetes bacterium]|nr:glycosidase [Candidatus Cloacimonadota bacterium]